MPIIIALVGAAAAWYFFFYRARNAAEIAVDIVDMANDVRLAARRFGFRRLTNIHPAESIEDAKVATAAVAIAFIQLDDLPTAELRARLGAALRADFVLTADETDELQVLGNWLVTQCGGAQGGVSRLGRKLYKLGGQPAFAPLIAVLKAVFGDDANLSARQTDALADLRLIFRIKV